MKDRSGTIEQLSYDEAQPYTGHFGGNWSKYTTADGLGHTFVHFLFEDNRGAIWAATFGGVSKLEGDRWRTYTTADGLGSNLAFFLLEDSRGILWAATAEGISRFDRNLDSWSQSGERCADGYT